MYQIGKINGPILIWKTVAGRVRDREEKGNTSHFSPMGHEIAGDVIYFDDLKENTSYPHTSVCSPCVGGRDYLTITAHSSAVTCLIIPSWLCVFVYMAAPGQQGTSMPNYCSAHIWLVGWSLLNVLHTLSQLPGLCRGIRLPEVMWPKLNQILPVIQKSQPLTQKPS